MRFYRRIIHIFSNYPLIANSVTGSFVYLSGELTVQYVAADIYDKIINLNYRRAIYLAMLGFIENGLIMLYWYKFLSITVGVSQTTVIVLVKCLLDQIFYATQQDSIFLLFYAYTQIKSNSFFSISKEEINGIFKEVSNNFLTTWINDCSIWPLVNFVGFAYFPYHLQPTFMSICQFFWQVYMSAVASNTKIVNQKVCDSIVNLDKAIVHKLESHDNSTEKVYYKSNFFNSFFEIEYFNKQKLKVQFDKQNHISKKNAVTVINATNELNNTDKSIDLKENNAIISDNIIDSKIDNIINNQLNNNPIVNQITKEINDEEKARELDRLRDREVAIVNAKLGISALFVCAIIRKFIFKL